MTQNKMNGVMTPILTPFNDDCMIAYDLYIEHARWRIVRPPIVPASPERTEELLQELEA